MPTLLRLQAVDEEEYTNLANPVPAPTTAPSVPNTAPVSVPVQAPAPPAITVPAPRAQFTRDVTLEDGSKVPPETDRVKIWKVKNVGVTSWPKGNCVITTAF